MEACSSVEQAAYGNEHKQCIDMLYLIQVSYLKSRTRHSPDVVLDMQNCMALASSQLIKTAAGHILLQYSSSTCVL